MKTQILLTLSGMAAIAAARPHVNILPTRTAKIPVAIPSGAVNNATTTSATAVNASAESVLINATNTSASASAEPAYNLAQLRAVEEAKAAYDKSLGIPNFAPTANDGDFDEDDDEDDDFDDEDDEDDDEEIDANNPPKNPLPVLLHAIQRFNEHDSAKNATAVDDKHHAKTVTEDTTGQQ